MQTGDGYMNKGYADFIKDIAENKELNEELCSAAPFADVNILQKWFTDRGYTISDKDADTIFQSQDMLLQEGENIAY